MNITAKSRYALKIMMDLALTDEQGHQQRHSIAQRQHVPVDFMDQITARLRSGGLIQSIRGRSGGFQLCKSPKEISIWEIFQSVEDSLYPVKCLELEACDLEDSCVSIGIWDDVFSSIRSALTQKTLADCVEKYKKECPSPCSIGVIPTVFGTCNRPKASAQN